MHLNELKTMPISIELLPLATAAPRGSKRNKDITKIYLNHHQQSSMFKSRSMVKSRYKGGQFKQGSPSRKKKSQQQGQKSPKKAARESGRPRELVI